MISQLAKLLAASMKGKLSQKRIQTVFASLPPVIPAEEGNEICVSALQRELKTYPSPEHWIRELDGIFAEEVKKGSRLVCLPEFYAMIPLLCHRVVALAVKGMMCLPAASENDGELPTIAPILEKFPFLMPAYEDIICRFAQRYGIYVYGGTGLVWEEGKAYNRGFLTSPAGQVIARQDKIHLTREELAMGITPGEEMQVVPTEIGNIALSVCMDATYFETFRVAKKLGADYILVPIGDMAEYDPFFALRGAQMRMNETGLTAIKPALVSAPNFPVAFSGKAGIYFPVETGYPSVEYPHPRQSGGVTGRFRLEDLRNLKSEYFCRTNPGFDRNYSDQLVKFARFGRKEI